MPSSAEATVELQRHVIPLAPKVFERRRRKLGIECVAGSTVVWFGRVSDPQDAISHFKAALKSRHAAQGSNLIS
jgi:hypothetical protein